MGGGFFRGYLSEAAPVSRSIADRREDPFSGRRRSAGNKKIGVTTQVMPISNTIKPTANTSKRLSRGGRTGAYIFLEAPPRLELGNRGFAVRCLTTWLWRHIRFVGDETHKSMLGAGNEARTRYLHLGKVALYRMSYAREYPVKNGVVPPVGVEPTTRGFSVRCSTY